VPEGYRVAPIFLIRLPGVPFESIEALGTPRIASLARQLYAARNERRKARAAVEKICRFAASSLEASVLKRAQHAIRSRQSIAEFGDALPDDFNKYAQSDQFVAELESKLARVIDLDLAAARFALWRESRKFLTRYLVFGTEDIRDVLNSRLLQKGATAIENSRNKFDKKIEQTLVLYLQRITTKNDTFSEFGPSTWGTAAPDEPGVSLNPESKISQRDVFLERWVAHHVATAVNTSYGRPDECNGADLKVRALDPHAFDALMADIAQWKNGPARSHWLSVLAPLAEIPKRFNEHTEAKERVSLVKEARSLLADLGATTMVGRRFLYTAKNPIAEECFRRSDFRIGENLFAELARDAAPWFDLWRDSYAFIASRVAAGLRPIFETASAGRESLPLPDFLGACASAKLPLTGPGLVALAAVAFQEVKAAFRARIQPHAGDEEYALTLEDCHVVRNCFEYPPFDEYTYPSADLQIAADSTVAISEGRYQWIVSELHPPVALLHHGVYWSCPDKNALNQALAESAGGKPNFYFGFFAADLTAHTTVHWFDALPELSYFVAPQLGKPNWQTVPPSNAEVFIDDNTGDICLRTVDSHQYLGSFARFWIIPLGFHPFQFGLAPHTPRLRCGRAIVQRQTWEVRADEMPPGSYKGVSTDLIKAVEYLRSVKNWPRYIYIRPSEQALRRTGAEGRDKDTKPIFIDLESYLFLETFHRWLVKAGELEVTEMLPAPDQLFWREADGRRTFELRTLIVPRE
jgi:hypothetical protein